ncbi:MAG: hypothetical protein IJF65_04685 [Clostridia bacterium]|nr:hypothetical protein [Clostridia bacterium]
MEKPMHFSIRVEKDVLRKFQFVAKYEDRSASGQMLYLINRCIRDFENEHGKIELSPDPKD